MGLKMYEHIHDYTDHQSTVFYLYIQNALLLSNTKIFNIPFINLTHNSFSIIMTFLGHDLFFKPSRVKSECGFKVTMVI